jgi:hypothetical protein
MLIFIIPMRSPQTTRDWPLVSRLAVRTVRSACAQSDPHFRVALVCNEPPEGLPSNPNLEIIHADFFAPGTSIGERMEDKWRKVKLGLIAMRSHAPAHFLLCDSDDCVHRDLASLTTAGPDIQGWNFSEGFIHDEGSPWLFRRKNFDRMCGTSSVVRLDPREIPQSMDEEREKYFILRYGHGEIGSWLAAQGRPLLRPPFEGAVYCTGNGENASGTEFRLWRSRRLLWERLAGARRLNTHRRALYGLYDLDHP